MRHISYKIPVVLFTFLMAFSLMAFLPVAANAEETSETVTETEEVVEDEVVEEEFEGDPTFTEDADDEEESTEKVSATTEKKTSSTETTTIKKTKAQIKAENLQRWLLICKKTLKTMKRYGFRYSNGGGKSTLKKSIKHRRTANCSYYVSWCLQQYGAIRSGGTFYAMGNSIHRSNFNWSSKKVKIIRVNKRCTRTKLHPGDVVCWKGVPHVCIYAGKSKSGKRLWYDGGKVATASNSNGSRYTHTSAQSLGYLNGRTISFIIRIKGL